MGRCEFCNGVIPDGTIHSCLGPKYFGLVNDEDWDDLIKVYMSHYEQFHKKVTEATNELQQRIFDRGDHHE